MKKFDLVKNTREVSYKDVNEICEGCTLNQIDQDPEILKTFDNKDEALKELESYTSEIEILTGGLVVYYQVTEYYVEENEYDEDGEWEGGGDIWAFSKMLEIER